MPVASNQRIVHRHIVHFRQFCRFTQKKNRIWWRESVHLAPVGTGGNMEQKMHTIEDILALPEGERAELIDGEMFMMATPTRRHRKIVGWLHAMIFNPKEGLIPRSQLRGHYQESVIEFKVNPRQDSIINDL